MYEYGVILPVDNSYITFCYTTSTMPETPEKKMEEAEFVHLHVHSMYSLLNAVPTPKELVKAAKADGQHAMAITDAGALYGAIDFYSNCHKKGIKPIIGVDGFIAPRTRHDKEMMDRPRARVVLLAKNTTGYKNLIKMVTISNTEGFYYRPRLDQELLKENSEGLICIIPSFAGEATLHLKNNDLEKAAAALAWYKEVYGENLYYEITYHPEILDHPELQEKIKTLATEGGVPLVAAQDIYYMQKDDAVIRALMMKIQSGGVVDPDEALSEDFSFATQEEMKEKFKDTPEAIANTVKIASQCNVEIMLGQDAWKFPDYKIKSGKNSDDELRDTAYAGITWRKHDINDPVIKKRINYELEVIKTKGYSTYFLVVGDLLREARERGIYTTIRGSVAGSYATYVLGITNVDPLEYKLPFERFLNPERPSAPDIDMDFADDRRDEIIEYAKEKYGADKVAQIGTFGTMMARAAVKDVARALGHPYSTGDRISKLIPMGSQGFAMTIDRAMEIESDLAKLYKQDSESRQVIDLAKRIEGRVRHMGVHAAGVVIAPEPLNQYVPIQVDSKTGKYVTQYEMHSVGEDGVGLLKFDFLGIKNLAILADAVKRVKKIHNVDVDIENVDVADTKTFQMLARGETMGLFQLNGTGMTSFLKQLKPSTIHDINAMVALYRPGPMESIPDYIERKHNPEKVTFLDPRLEKILDRSYGVITYQDDVMMISIALAGYSWLDADKLRKAMGKKIPAVMEAEKAKLMDGFQNFGKLSPAVADKLWERIEPFAAYGFNKCLPASTRIINAKTGIPTTITNLIEAPQKEVTILSLDTHQSIVRKTATKPFENGVKTVYELTTRSGRVIRATNNHPFKTWGSWQRLDTLQTGDRIAVPRRLTSPDKHSNLTLNQAATLGYLISEGNLCHPHGLYYYSKDIYEIQDFIRHAKTFKNTKITIDTSKSTQSIYIGQKNPKEGNTLRRWIDSLGLLNKTATEKLVPDIVFAAPDKVISCFLGTLWQGDGCISNKNQQAFYATSSKQLAYDVQHLLLRIDILSTIHKKSFVYRGGHKIGWTVVLTGTENISSFAKNLGPHLLTTKKSDLEKLVKESKIRTNNRGRGTVDTLPMDVLQEIRHEMTVQCLTVKKVAQQAQIAPRLLHNNSKKRGLTRTTVLKIAKVLQSKQLIEHAVSDIFWDEVVSINKTGKEMTYDLSVPETHNFIADDFFVHNSHAASYGRVAYQTAYMKANYPEEYMAAVLTADSGDIEKISEIIHECERMGLEVLPPDINESFAPFSVVPAKDGEEAKIRFGLTTIKNFGAGIAHAIIEERKANGDFQSLTDLLTRVHDKNLNKKSIEALIMTGALDRFEERGKMHANVDNLLAFNKEQVTGVAANQDSLFGGMDTAINELTLQDVDPVSKEQKLIWEKELLGVYVSGHPLDQFMDELNNRGDITAIKADGRNGIPVVTAGMIENVKELITKKGDHMAFVKLGNLTDSIEMVTFPETYQTYKELLIPGNCVAIKGKLNIRNDEPSILVDKIKVLAPKEPTVIETKQVDNPLS